MHIKNTVVIEKKERKTPSNQRAPLHLVAAHEATLNPAEVGASPERTAAFDPRALPHKTRGWKNQSGIQRAMSPSSRKETRRMRCSTSRAAK